jgi:SAM-dependent methyltransferase
MESTLQSCGTSNNRPSRTRTLASAKWLGSPGRRRSPKHMTQLRFSNLEYIALRLVRRFFFPADLQRVGRYLPFYRTNLAEVSPEKVCELYSSSLAQVSRSVEGNRIVEVGSGSTNGAGYALVCSGASRVWCIEPYVALDPMLDASLLAKVARQYRLGADSVGAAVRRCAALANVGAGQADLILSHSVLEHLTEPAAEFSQMKHCLSKQGAMLHIVDYRDHFFKYPLHFLQFSQKTWQRFLNPGDLPRWRLGDHLTALEQAGFSVRVLHQEEDPHAFERIRPHISNDFDADDPSIGVLRAVLFCVHKEPDSGTGREPMLLDGDGVTDVT